MTAEPRNRDRRADKHLLDPARLLDNIPIIVWEVDRSGAILSANAATSSLLGYQPGELETLSLAQIVPKLARGGAPYQKLLTLSNSKAATELTVQARSGRPIPMAVRCSQPDKGKPFVLTFRDLRERKRFERKRRAQRQYQRRIIETAGDAIITLDDKQRITLFSPKAEEMFGRLSNEVIGKTFDRTMLPAGQGTADFLSLLDPSRGRVRATQNRIEVFGLRRTGETFPAEASISHFRFAGKPLVTIVLRDLTEARAAAQAARANEQLFKMMFDQALLYLAILNPSGQIVEVNRATKKLIAKGSPPPKGLYFWDAPWWHTPDGTSDQVKHAISRAMQGVVVREELTARFPDGSSRNLDFSAKPIRGDDNGVLQILAAARDVTRKVKAERALRESERRLANAQRIAQLGHWDWNVTTNELFWSDEIYGIFRRDCSTFEATYAAFLNCIHPEDRQAVEEAVNEALHSGHEYKIDHRIVCPDGSIRYVHEQGEISFDEAGKPQRMTGVVQDITEAKISEQNLRDAKVKAEAANQAKSAFLANMSHELRTPLNAILGFSEIMMKKMFGPLPERYHTYPREIHDSGEHLLDIVNDILDMAKIEHGNFTAQDQPVELVDIIDYCTRVTAGSAKAAGLTLTSECAPRLPQLWADPVLLRRVILNLLSNAIKFTLPGGTVRLTAELTEDGGIAIAVADTGIGIAAEDIPKALEPFGQIESTLCRRRGGTGLGLPLSQSLIALHDGRFQIDSSPGCGTRVIASLPKTRVINATESVA